LEIDWALNKKGRLLSLNPLYYRGGLLVTADAWEQDIVRAHPEFLKSIFPVLIDIEECLKKDEAFYTQRLN
jgi:hypothetical protein